MKDEQEFFERRIVIGLIVSAEYMERVLRFWKPSLLDAPELRAVAEWCVEYFEKYRKVPDKNIQDIYMERLSNGELSSADAEYIEALLASLSDEYGRGTQFNAAYLYDRTVKYFKTKELERHNKEVDALVAVGQVVEAEALVASYKPTIFDDIEVGLDLASDAAAEAVERAFSSAGVAVVTYPGALGKMWNDHLVRGGFFTFLAPEKRGKSFFLMEIALRSIRQKANVAYFEAGDMTESQILRRICVYIAQRSDKPKYCEERFRPMGDCVLNQIDDCIRDDRNCDHGIFDVRLSQFEENRFQFLNMETLTQKFKDNPDYAPCDSHSCDERIGSVWLKKIKKTRPLNVAQAKRLVESFFKKYRRRFKLITYPAGTLTTSEMRRILDIWERQDGFVPDVIVIDYADLLAPDGGGVQEFRHKQDQVWKSLRALSQERHVLTVTATQADADSYKKDSLSLSNFSEDKRKLAHVTAQYGLNQDPQGKEKRLGILRVNEIVVREGEFSPDNEVTVLQDLAAGRAYLESF